ncbi:MAG: PD-(D/E)XK nuclease family protein [Solobacterium sp.]|nr:PD-(D/E)XK nuclease family protein [Solobacterium sp.]
MKYILAQAQDKARIAHQIAQESGTSGFTQIQFLTISQLLKKAQSEPTNQLLLDLSHQLIQNQENFPIYREMFQYASFLQEILAFTRSCILYQIPIEDLPANTSLEKELREILRVAYDLPLIEKEILKEKEDALKKAMQYEDLTIYPLFEAEPFYHHFLMELLQNNPNVKEIKWTQTPKSIRYHYALSLRQELEAIAQDICNHKQPANIILTNYSEQYPLLKQVFHRYNIPFASYSNPVYTSSPSKFTKLVRFGMQKDVDSFIDALKIDAFSISLSNEEIQHYDQHLLDMDSFFKEDHPLTQEAHTLYEEDNISKLFQLAYQILQKSPLINENETQALLSIRHILNQTIPYIQNEADGALVLEFISNSTVEESTMLTDFCVVTDLSHPTFPQHTSYVVGCSGRNYPGIPKRSGLFDEAYIQKIKSYPTYQERHKLYMELLDWIPSSCENLVYSRATNDYQGREIQPSYLLESAYSPTPWPLIKPNEPVKRQHQLSKSTSKQLFLHKDGKIHGSISRIERYFNCPYSYFLQSGLKVRPALLNANDARTIGSLSHSVLEEVIKNNTSQINKTIEDLLNPSFEELEATYPKDMAQLQLTKQRLQNTLLQNVQHLKEVDANNLFKPVHTEYPFDTDQFEGISLHGIIDRIDEVNGYYRILDYKSSAHALSETKVKAGIQLQLLTYLIVYEAEGGIPAGSYYYSFKLPNSELLAGSLSKKSGVSLQDTFEKEDYEKAKNKNQRLTGWTFVDPSQEYTDFETYYSPKKLYSYPAVKECITELYQYFKEHLEEGDISLAPVEGACTFCDYLSICRYHDGENDVMPLVKQEEALTVKGGKDQ